MPNPTATDAQCSFPSQVNATTMQPTGPMNEQGAIDISRNSGTNTPRFRLIIRAVIKSQTYPPPKVAKVKPMMAGICIRPTLLAGNR